MPGGQGGLPLAVIPWRADGHPQPGPRRAGAEMGEWRIRPGERARWLR